MRQYNKGGKKENQKEKKKFNPTPYMCAKMASCSSKYLATAVAKEVLPEPW